MRLALLIAIAYLSCIGCREDEPICNDPTNRFCPNFDPCLVFEFADAEFSIIQSIYGVDCLDGRGRLDLNHEVDTGFANSDLVFEALHDADSYEWQIGTDPKIHTEKKFDLFFPRSIAPATITVRLVVCKQPPQDCEGFVCDTFSRTIHLIDVGLEDSTFSLVIGSFRGSNTDTPLDSFTIIIPPYWPTQEGIINFPDGCVGQYLDVSLGRNGFILRTASHPCQSACGIGLLMDDRRTLVIDYSVRVGSERILKKFIGVKLP
jgi:hypothetical protein